MRKDFNGITRLEIILASGGPVRKLPHWDKIRAKRIIHPFRDFMADGGHIGKVGAQNPGIHPASPHEGLDQRSVLAFACIKGRVETHDAAFLRRRSWGQQYVVGQSDGQRLNIKVLQLNDGI